MATLRFLPSRQSFRPARQRGLVLVIALIVLVAMSLAAVALTRSVDVANIAAGNLSFSRGALSATDRGVEAAIAKFRGPVGSLFVAGTANDNAGQGYFARIQPSDSRGVPTALLDPDAFDGAYAANKITLASTGETVRYFIDRQCTQTGEPSSAFCAVSPRPGGKKGTVKDLDTSSPLFRVTVRVDGPKRTVSYSQVLFR